jgi:hypothetical protein
MAPRAARAPARRSPPAAATFLLLLALALPAPAVLASSSPPTSPPSSWNTKLGGKPRRPAQIGTSFVQTSFWDLEADAGGGKTTCETVVERSLGYGTDAIAIVLTVEARGYENGLEQFFYKGESVVLVSFLSFLFFRRHSSFRFCERLFFPVLFRRRTKNQKQLAHPKTTQKHTKHPPKTPP